MIVLKLPKQVIVIHCLASLTINSYLRVNVLYFSGPFSCFQIHSITSFQEETRQRYKRLVINNETVQQWMVADSVAVFQNGKKQSLSLNTSVYRSSAWDNEIDWRLWSTSWIGVCMASLPTISRLIKLASNDAILLELVMRLGESDLHQVQRRKRRPIKRGGGGTALYFTFSVCFEL